MREVIAKAEPEYQTYAARRFLDEFRRKGVMPDGIDPEAWRLSLLAFEARERDPMKREHADPYGEGFEAVQAGAGFPRQCAAQLPRILGTADARPCACLAKVFERNLDPDERWALETRFSPEMFWLTSVSHVGLHAKVRSCLN